MSSLHLVAVDLGASNGRAILGHFDGKRIEWEEVYRFANNGRMLHNAWYWDILDLSHRIGEGLREAAQKVEEITSVGIDTWGVDYGLLDANDQLMSNPFHYRDPRTDGLMEEVLTKVPAKELYGTTGIQFMQLNTLFQLYADRKYRPWILDNASSLLFMPDLLNFILTGAKNNELTIASTSQMWNPLEGRWASEILQRLDIPERILQPIIKPGYVIGPLRRYFTQEYGLTNHPLSVVAVGSHDTASAVAATPLRSRNSIYLSCGTWSLIGMELDEPVLSEQAFQANFTNELGVNGKVRFLKNVNGLWFVQECRRSWKHDGMDISYGEMERLAQKASPFKFLIEVNDPQFLAPQNMPKAIQQHCAATGQPVPTEVGEFVRGIYEGLALSYREVVDTLEDMMGVEIDTIHMVGGGSQAQLLCQFTADATGKTVLAGPVEATALGNMLVQLMACGEISGLDEGREIVRASIELKEYRPRESEMWNEASVRFKELKSGSK